MSRQAPDRLQPVTLRGADGSELRGRVHDVDGQQVVLGVPEDQLLPPVGADVAVRWSSWRGLHECVGVRVADGESLRVELHEPTCLQRREFARVAASVPVRLHLLDGSTVDAVSLDLSEGGLRLVLHDCPPLPDDLVVELAFLPGCEPQPARIVRRDDGDTTDTTDPATTLAVAFIPPVRPARALRSDVLARQARARRLEA
jgi:hypothetical protein